MSHQIFVTGNVVRAPESKITSGGREMTTLTLADTKWVSKKNRTACPQGWKEAYYKNGWEHVTFWRVTFWNGAGKEALKFRKGQAVEVTGEVTGTLDNGVQTPLAWVDDESHQPRGLFTMTAWKIAPHVSNRRAATAVPQPTAAYNPDPESDYNWPTDEPPAGF